MSFGVSLSQLISSSKNSVIKTGIDDLDDCFDGSLQSRSIYEVYGPPGIGKTKLGLQIVSNFLRQNEPSQGNNILWIDTYKQFPANLLYKEELKYSDQFNYTQITKISQLTVFFTKLLQIPKSEPDLAQEDTNEKKIYKLVIIDGFSTIINDHLHNISRRMNDNSDISLHEMKSKHLIMLLTLMTKFTHANGSTILLLNQSMNTAFSLDFDISSPEDYLSAIAGSNFLVRNTLANDPRKSVQVLRSELVSNIGIGTRDSRWEVFIRNRIGLFWDWEHKDKLFNKNLKTRYNKIRIAVVSNIQDTSRSRIKDKDRDSSPISELDSSQRKYRSQSPASSVSEYRVRIFCNSDGEFCSSNTVVKQIDRKRSISPDPKIAKKKQAAFIDIQSSPSNEQSSLNSQNTLKADQSIISNIDEGNDISDIVNEDDEIIYDSEG